MSGLIPVADASRAEAVAAAGEAGYKAAAEAVAALAAVC